MPNGQQPIFIMQDGTERTRGKSAQGNNIAAARAVADAVKTTLGPKGMDKMLVNGMGDVLITNDGATILREISIEHPAAKMLIEVSQTQETYCHDGTTSAVILAGALLKESEALVEKNVHPTVIAAGYRMAADHALNILDECVLSDEESSQFDSLPASIAQTALTGKSADAVRGVIAGIAEEAIQRLGAKPNLDDIHIICATGGSIEDSHLADGIVLEKERAHDRMPKSITDAQIALIGTAIEVRKTEVDARINITSPDQMSAFLDEEESTLKAMVQHLVDVGVNVVCCQKEIDDLALHYLAKAGIMAVQQCRKSTLVSISRATGANIVNDFDDLSKEDTGSAECVMEERIGDNLMIVIQGVSDEASSLSVILHGATTQVVEEIERAFEDAIGVIHLVLKELEVTAGGGSTHIEMAQGLRLFAGSVIGRKQMAVDAFATALESIPTIIAENAGLDPVETILTLRQQHNNSKINNAKFIGVNVDEDLPTLTSDMLYDGVIEPKKVVEQTIQSATEAAIMILRIDDVIQMKQTGAGPPPMM